MQVTLRQVGNSIGLTIPTSELKLMNAHVGDLVEIEIKRVIRHARAEKQRLTRFAPSTNPV